MGIGAATLAKWGIPIALDVGHSWFQGRDIKKARKKAEEENRRAQAMSNLINSLSSSVRHQPYLQEAEYRPSGITRALGAAKVGYGAYAGLKSLADAAAKEKLTKAAILGSAAGTMATMKAGQNVPLFTARSVGSDSVELPSGPGPMLWTQLNRVDGRPAITVPETDQGVMSSRLLSELGNIGIADIDLPEGLKGDEAELVFRGSAGKAVQQFTMDQQRLDIAIQKVVQDTRARMDQLDAIAKRNELAALKGSSEAENAIVAEVRGLPVIENFEFTIAAYLNLKPILDDIKKGFVAGEGGSRTLAMGHVLAINQFFRGFVDQRMSVREEDQKRIVDAIGLGDKAGRFADMLKFGAVLSDKQILQIDNAARIVFESSARAANDIALGVVQANRTQLGFLTNPEQQIPDIINRSLVQGVRASEALGYEARELFPATEYQPIKPDPSRAYEMSPPVAVEMDPEGIPYDATISHFRTSLGDNQEWFDAYNQKQKEQSQELGGAGEEQTLEEFFQEADAERGTGRSIMVPEREDYTPAVETRPDPLSLRQPLFEEKDVAPVAIPPEKGGFLQQLNKLDRPRGVRASGPGQRYAQMSPEDQGEFASGVNKALSRLDRASRSSLGALAEGFNLRQQRYGPTPQPNLSRTGRGGGGRGLGTAYLRQRLLAQERERLLEEERRRRQWTGTLGRGFR